MKTIFSHTIIEGTAEMVWSVLADFKRYPQWNPVIDKIVGEPKIHASLHLSMVLPEWPSASFNARIVVMITNFQLKWVGDLINPRIKNIEQCFKILHYDQQSVILYVQTSMPFEDWLFYDKNILRKFQQAQEQILEAIKCEVESDQLVKNIA